MSDVAKFELGRHVWSRVHRLAGNIVAGAGNTIASQTGVALCGVTFTKNAASGRYDGVLYRGFKRAICGAAQVGSAAAGTFNQIACRLGGIPPGAWLGNGVTPVASFSVQAIFNQTGTAINPGAGQTISWWLEVSDL